VTKEEPYKNNNLNNKDPLRAYPLYHSGDRTLDERSGTVFVHKSWINSCPRTKEVARFP
jgi:hypothetical protein